jgi:putative membrane protein
LDTGTNETGWERARKLRDRLVEKGWLLFHDLEYCEAEGAGHNEAAASNRPVGSDIAAILTGLVRQVASRRARYRDCDRELRGWWRCYCAGAPSLIAFASTFTRQSTMDKPSDPRVLYAAERTLLAWQRSSLALMGFGFLVERFSDVVPGLRGRPAEPWHHGFALIVGVLFILLGSAVAISASLAYGRLLRTLPREDVPPGYWTGLGVVINWIVGIAGCMLAGYLLFSAV